MDLELQDYADKISAKRGKKRERRRRRYKFMCNIHVQVNVIIYQGTNWAATVSLVNHRTNRAVSNPVIHIESEAID